MIFRCGLMAMVLAVAIPVTANAAVSVDYDHQADFSRYRTYAWIEGTPAPNPLGEQRIREALGLLLQKAGLTPVENSPDLFIASHAKANTQKQISIDSYGYGGWYRGGYGATTTSAQIYDVPLGTLMIDMIDTGTKQLVWRGVATETLSDKPKKNYRKIDKVTRKMFKKFPREPDGK